MSVFITIEGPDGSGKTSVTNKLIQALQNQGLPIVYTREPGGSEIAEEIRQVILDCKNTAMDPRTEALLYAASRRQHLVEKIWPALQAGKIVFSDRFLDSSLAYQGYGRDIGMQAVLDINLFATEGKLPDLTLYFDVSAEVGLARINHDKDREINRLDLEKNEFHQKVREGYLLLLQQFPKRIHLIDASQPFDQVYADTYQQIKDFFNRQALMAIKEFLQTTQAVAYQTIRNGFIRQKTSHAYLLVGSQGSPLKSMGVFLAQSFLCEQPDPLACEACLTCIRIEDYSYIDFTLIDGESASIKKEDIDNLQSDFSKTALEIAGKKVYLIHLLENASTGAVNSILKFLEEPGDNVVGIITTQNVSKILPTIVSRCQLIRLKNTTKQGLIDALEQKGILLEDARLLAQDKTTIEEVEAILEDENFHLLKEMAMASFKQFVEDETSIHYYIQRHVIPKIGSRQQLYVYLQVLETLLRDVTYRDSPSKMVFTSLQKWYAAWNAKFAIHQMLEIILYAKGSVDNNVNTALALDRLYYELMTCQ